MGFVLLAPNNKYEIQYPQLELQIQMLLWAINVRVIPNGNFQVLAGLSICLI